MFERFAASVTNTATQIGKEFQPSNNARIITYEGNVLQYWWQCYKIIQLFRYMCMYTSVFDEQYFTQLTSSIVLVREHCTLIDNASNCQLLIRQMMQLCSIHERIAAEISNKNNNNFFGGRDRNVSIQSGSRPLAIERNNMPWYATLLTSVRSYTQPSGIDDSIGRRPDATPFRINGAVHAAREVTDDEKRAYAYCIFLCFFYGAQLSSVGMRNIRIARECIRKMERYLDNALIMEALFTERCTFDEQKLLIIRFFDLTSVVCDNDSMLYTAHVKQTIDDWSRRLSQCGVIHEDIGLSFFNVETMRYIDLLIDTAETPFTRFVSIPSRRGNKRD